MPPLSRPARETRALFRNPGAALPTRHAALLERCVERRLRGPAQVLSGHHNTNHVLRLGLLPAVLVGAVPFARLKYRVPRETVEVVPRIWPREWDVLRVVCRFLPEVPRCLAVLGDNHSLHVYRGGTVLSDRGPHGRIGEGLMRQFAAFFARTAGIPAGELPPLPEDWPADGDSDGFLRRLVRFTEERVHRPHRPRFGTLFDAVGIPEDAMARFLRGLHPLTPRPFALLHTDVHRANVVVRRNRIAVIDWELALFGDPLHDLATHLVRMGYDKEEQARMTALWAEAMTRAGRAELTAALHDDLGAYLAFEYAQSVYPDVLRAALALPPHATADDFHAAAHRIGHALSRAREPLRLVDVPPEPHLIDALRHWHDAQNNPATPR
ncbi:MULTISPECIES: phosphotransferase family protein [unclassified Streptomyces]|uniref:phosphotransferase family protein n=1 Tax=unclassified Streptomyces TaxID=2593676 RepID=UPI0037017FBB